MSGNIIDMHVHLGLLGDEHPEWGHFSDDFRRNVNFKIFLKYARVKEEDVNDGKLIERTEEILGCSDVDKVVCLALDPVYTSEGIRREDLSYTWVNNDYVIKLRDGNFREKVLLGASVHPYDPDFKDRVKKYVEKGAVLLKWVPSSQQIFLDDDRVRDALVYLASAKDGKPLPLLLHTGMEYAIPTTDFKTQSNDFLCWDVWDKAANLIRWPKSWNTPKLQKIHSNLKYGLDNGAIIIFAHCGLQYFAPSWFKLKFEHSDFDVVRDYLLNYPPGNPDKGCCYADVSAFATPFRKGYYSEIMQLPPQSLLFGSDFPTPVFEMWADQEEKLDDLKAILNGDFERIIIPEDNLLDVNYKVLSHFFGNHPLFTNFNNLLTSN